jgi:predicted ATPase
MSTLQIKNFKCFEEVSIPLNALTIMAGANGMGKSTSIQALLLLRKLIELGGFDAQTQEPFRRSKIALNEGYCLQLGDSSAILRQGAEGNEIEIRLDVNAQWIIGYFDVDNISQQLYVEGSLHTSTRSRISHGIEQEEFYYLNAERIGPRVQQSLNHNLFLHAGWQGENTAQVLDHEGGYFKIDPARQFPVDQLGKGTKEATNRSLYIADQVNAWLGYLMPGVTVKAKTDPTTLSGQVLLQNNSSRESAILATNLGFGISYLLPIIANGLIAKRDTMFIVENPEAHLHPAAQSRIGIFLAKVASAGVQVIVETHSDHVLNGIQIAVAEQIIPADQVTVNFFGQEPGENQPQVTSIAVSHKGELTRWPKGFFDQTQIDYAHLTKLRRNV